MTRHALLIPFLAGLLAQLACAGEAPPSQDARPPVNVRLARAVTVELRVVFEAGGTVRARNTATVVSRIVAEVRDIRVTTGDRVSAGQVLMTLDDREPTANRLRAEAAATAAVQSEQAAAAGLAAAEARLKLASVTHARIAGLREKNSATPNELDAATADLRAAEAQVDAARAQVSEAGSARTAARAGADAARISASYAALTAPFTGVVTEKLIDVGNLASPGVPLLRIEDTRAYRLEVRLDASRAGLLAPGQPVGVELGGTADDAGGQPTVRLDGSVSEIARALDPGSQAFLVKIDLPDHGGVRSGLFGRARFPGSARRALAVPSASLVRQGQLVHVWVVDADGRARLRLVNVAAGSGELTEVLAGLDDGEFVIVGPPTGLTDGTRVATKD